MVKIFDVLMEYLAGVEWLGHKQSTRSVVLTLDEIRQRIIVSENAKVVRIMDLFNLDKSSTEPVSFILSADVNMKLMLVRVPKEYDLVLYNTDKRNGMRAARKILRASVARSLKY